MAEPDAKDESPPDPRRRWASVFGWLGGICLGVLLNYGLFLAFGARPEDYPVVPTTFVAVVGGGFAGLAVADRLGARGFRPLGILAGVLLSMFLALVLSGLIGPSGP